MAAKPTYEELERRVKELEDENFDRKRAGEVLREREEQYRSLVETTEDSIYLLNKDSIYQFVNEKHLSRIGCKADGVIGKRYGDFYPLKDTKEFLKKLGEVFETGETTQHEHKSHRDNRYFLRTMSPVKSSEGHTTSVTVISKEISERKQAEEALRESEGLHKQAQRVAHIGHWELNPEIGTPVWSDEIFRIFGLNPQESEPSFTDHETHLHPDDWPLLNKAVTLASTEGTHFDIIFRIVRPDGEIGWIHAIGTTTKDEKGKVTKLFGTAQDITKQKQAEEALRESEEKYRSLFEGSIDSIVFTSQHGEFIDANTAALELFGYTKKEILKMHFQKLYVDPDEGYRLRKEMEEKDSVQNFETRLCRKSDVEMDCILDMVCRRSDDGSILEYQGIIRDISEAKCAQQALKASQQRLSQIINFLPDATFAIDLEGKVITWNQAMENLSGIKAQEMLGKGDYEYATPFYGERRPVLINLVGKRDKEIEKKYQFVKKEGESLVCETYDCLVKPGGFLWCKASFLYDQSGEVIGAIQSFRDITDRKVAEEALRESEEKYRNILKNIEDGYFEVDIAGNFTFFNESLGKILGYSKDELVGMNNSEYTDQENAKKLYAAFNTVHTTGKPDKGFDWEIIRKDGSKGYVEASVSLRKGSEDQPIGFRGIVRDITVQKKMLERLQKTKKLESLGVLAGGIAHDFNNLMSAVMGNISLARIEMKPGSKGFKNLVQAEKASIQTKELTARLITFSKGGEPIKETVSVGNLVKDSVTSLLKGSDINAEFSIPDGISLTKVDKDQMKQSIHNIVTNAQEAVGEQGTINVSCENVNIGEKDTLTLKDGKYVKISIVDQGPGIPDKDLAKIFDPYFSTKEMGTQKGMGLGLSVSDSIVKKHDGIITVESELGTGTTFSIYLPASVKEIIESAPVKKPVPEISVTRGGKILVMDDEEVIRDVSNALLTHLGYNVGVAVEGVEVIEMYEKAMKSEKPFEAVILDLTNKVGMGGAEAMAKLLEIDSDVKAIVTTGYSSDPIMNKFREHGFRGALPKPFNLDHLKTALQDAIGGE